MKGTLDIRDTDLLVFGPFVIVENGYGNETKLKSMFASKAADLKKMSDGLYEFELTLANPLELASRTGRYALKVVNRDLKWKGNFEKSLGDAFTPSKIVEYEIVKDGSK